VSTGKSTVVSPLAGLREAFVPFIGQTVSAELREQFEYWLKHCMVRVGFPPQYLVTVTPDPIQTDLLHLRITRRTSEEKPCSPEWGDVTTVEGRPYYRYDFDSCDSKEAEEHYYSTQEMLRKLGLEIKSAHIEHDCVSGFLGEYQA